MSALAVSPSATDGAALPDYARRVDASGGAFTLFWLNLLFRLGAKHMLAIDADIPKLRAKQEKMDVRFGKIDPEVRHRSMPAVSPPNGSTHRNHAVNACCFTSTAAPSCSASRSRMPV